MYSVNCNRKSGLRTVEWTWTETFYVRGVQRQICRNTPRGQTQISFIQPPVKICLQIWLRDSANVWYLWKRGMKMMGDCMVRSAVGSTQTVCVEKSKDQVSVWERSVVTGHHQPQQWQQVWAGLAGTAQRLQSSTQHPTWLTTSKPLICCCHILAFHFPLIFV